MKRFTPPARAAREAVGLTAAEVAKRYRIAESTLLGYERSGRFPIRLIAALPGLYRCGVIHLLPYRKPGQPARGDRKRTGRRMPPPAPRGSETMSSQASGA